MRMKIVSDNRDMILRILQDELSAVPEYSGIPDFTCRIGAVSITRNGYIETVSENDPNSDVSDTEPVRHALNVLCFLGLCSPLYQSCISDPPDSSDCTPALPTNSSDIAYPLSAHTGSSLLNIFCMVSARQRLINQAIDSTNAFRISHDLIGELLRHPPETLQDFRQSLYGKDDAHDGLELTADQIIFNGFNKAHTNEKHIHQQLADHIISSSLDLRWTKASTPNVRNRKYAFRTWLNSIGMSGPDYEEARSVMLARLYGRSDRRKL